MRVKPVPVVPPSSIYKDLSQWKCAYQLQRRCVIMQHKQMAICSRDIALDLFFHHLICSQRSSIWRRQGHSCQGFGLERKLSQQRCSGENVGLKEEDAHWSEKRRFDSNLNSQKSQWCCTSSWPWPSFQMENCQILPLHNRVAAFQNNPWWPQDTQRHPIKIMDILWPKSFFSRFWENTKNFTKLEKSS